MSLDKQTFNREWEKAEKVILRLGSDITGLDMKLKQLKHETIDPQKEKEYQEMIAKYREMEQTLVSDVNQIKDSVSDVGIELDTLKSRFEDHCLASKRLIDQAQRHDTALEKVTKDQGKLTEDFEGVQRMLADEGNEIEKIKARQSEVEDKTYQTLQSYDTFHNRLQQVEQKNEADMTVIYSRLDASEARLNQTDTSNKEGFVGIQNSELENLAAKANLHLQDKQRQDTFVSTAAHRTARDILKTNGCVVLTGLPGEGKTTIGLQILLEFRDIGKRVLKLNDPEDWKKINLEKGNVDVIFIDDIFGSGALDQELFSGWSHVLGDMFKAVQMKRICAILTTRHYILEEAQKRMHKLHMFQDKNTVFVTSYELTEEEKSQMLRVHLLHTKREIAPDLVEKCVRSFDYAFKDLAGSMGNHIWPDGTLSDYLRMGKISTFKSVMGYPEIVSLFTQNDHLFKLGRDFFESPFIFFKKCMEDLYRDEKKFLALVLVWTRHTKTLKLADIEPPEASDELKKTAKEFGFKLKNETIKVVRDSLEYHKDGFLRFDTADGVYSFCHNLVKDMVGLVAGKECPNVVLEYASLEFLLQYVTIDTCKAQDGLHILIEQYRYELLIDKMWKFLKTERDNDWSVVIRDCIFYFFTLTPSKGYFKNLSVLKHDCFESKHFVHLFLKRDIEMRLFAEVIGVSQDKFGYYEIDIPEKIPIHVPSVALFYGTSGLLSVYLESAKDEELNEKFLYINTLLAVHGDLLDTVKELYRYGAAVYEDAIYLAARKGHLDILNFLLQNKSKRYNATSDVNNGNSPLIAAAKNGSTECMKCLLDDGRDVNYHNTKGWKAVDKAILYGNIKVCEVLLDSGSSVNYKCGKYNRTPLHRSADTGRAEICKLLLKHGASVTIQDKRGHLPVHCAAIQGYHEIVDLLLNAGYKDKQVMSRISYGRKSVLKGATLYHAAVWKNEPGVIEVLIEHNIDASVRDFYGRTAIYTAAYEGKTDIVKKLLDVSNIDTADNRGFTPLHAAIHRGHKEIAEMICPFADVNKRDKLGKTPLHTACERLDLNTFKVLVKTYRADVRMLTGKGQCVFDILEKKCKDVNIYTILKREEQKKFIFKQPRWVDFQELVKDVDEEFAEKWKSILHIE